MSRLNVAFVVQGEGRGHLTQALALAGHLRSAGHVVHRVLVGRSPQRPIPDYFLRDIAHPVIEFEAPAQLYGPERRGLSAWRTAVDAGRRMPAFARSTATIANATRDADVVVNFLDLMGGLARLRRREPQAPSVAIAHNHLFLHPSLAGAPGPQHMRRIVLAYATATRLGSARTLALSFEAMGGVPSQLLDVMPPLLRPGLASLDATDGDYLLAYALNPGYGSELARWQARRPEAVVHCYIEGGAAALPETGQGFHAHDLDAEAFLRHLAGCRAYVGTAGFESICEAHYLGKPVLAVPTEGQFEQTLNAWDAQRCGVARAGSYADLDDFWENPEIPSPADVRRFRRWVESAPELFVEAVEHAART